MRHVLTGWIVACCVVPLMSTATMAQQTSPPAGSESQQPASAQRQTDQANPNQRQHTGQLDHVLTAWLIFDNQKEIAISELGERFAQNQQVRDFAEQMTQEHRELVDRLQEHLKADAEQRRDQRQARGEQARNEQQRSDRQQEQATPENAENRGEGQERQLAQQDADQRRDANRPQRQGNRGADLELLRIKQQICEQNARSVAQALTEKQGEHFDAAFIGVQIAGHMHMIDTLTVFQEQTSGDLQALVREARQTTEQHLQHAKDIMRDLKEQHDQRSQEASQTTGQQ